MLYEDAGEILRVHREPWAGDLGLGGVRPVAGVDDGLMRTVEGHFSAIGLRDAYEAEIGRLRPDVVSGAPQRAMLAFLRFATYGGILGAGEVEIRLPAARPEILPAAPVGVVLAPRHVIGRCRLDIALVARVNGRVLKIDVECGDSDAPFSPRDRERDRCVAEHGFLVARVMARNIRRHPLFEAEKISEYVADWMRDCLEIDAALAAA